LPATNVRWHRAAARIMLYGGMRPDGEWRSQAHPAAGRQGGATVNQKTRRRLEMGLVWIVLAVPVATGCASSSGPLANTKVASAQRAVDDAQQAGAAVSVPVELRAAEDKLKAAQMAVSKKDYDEAIAAADQAAVDADYARARASNERVKKMADEMRRNIQTLRQELERLPQ
jgi:Domain of unknown function (DUF4398)